MGEVLTPIEVQPWDVDAFLTGFHEGMAATVAKGKGARHAALAMLLGLHHSTAMRGSQTKWIGVAVAYMLRLGAAASIGEWRHKRKALDQDRSKLHQRCFSNQEATRDMIPKALQSFGVEDWGGSYGGPAWADCTASLLDLDDAMVQLHQAAEDTQMAALTQVLNVFNIVVNKAHNGGWWMNKFVEQAAFDRMAQGNFQLLPLAGSEMYRVHALARKCPNPVVASREYWAQATPLPRDEKAMKTVLVFRGKGKDAAIDHVQGAKYPHDEENDYPNDEDQGAPYPDSKKQQQWASMLTEQVSIPPHLTLAGHVITGIVKAQVKVDHYISPNGVILHAQIAHDGLPLGKAYEKVLWACYDPIVGKQLSHLPTLATGNSLACSETQYALLDWKSTDENHPTGAGWQFWIPCDGTPLFHLSPAGKFTVLPVLQKEATHEQTPTA
jgi:hypothetical protein